MKSMFLKKLQTAAVAAVAVAAIALTGASAYRGHAAPVPKNAPVPADGKQAAEALADAEGRLLMNRKVLKDMKCDIDPFGRIMDALEAAEKQANQKPSESMGQLRANAAGAPRTREAVNQVIRDAQEAGEKEFRKAVGSVVTDVLTPAQRKRFREIDFQARGHEAFTNPAVIKALHPLPINGPKGGRAGRGSWPSPLAGEGGGASPPGEGALASGDPQSSSLVIGSPSRGLQTRHPLPQGERAKTTTPFPQPTRSSADRAGRASLLPSLKGGPGGGSSVMRVRSGADRERRSRSAGARDPVPPQLLRPNIRRGRINQRGPSSTARTFRARESGVNGF